MTDDDLRTKPFQWVRDTGRGLRALGWHRGNTLRDTGMPVVIVTTRGNKTGAVRKMPLMRVEHGGEWALIASKGGAPTHPEWYRNLLAAPEDVAIQDGPSPVAVTVREVHGAERDEWWARAVAAYPPYAEYQEKTTRVIPVLVATPR